MIKRTVKYSLGSANKGKLAKIDSLLSEMTRVTNKYVEILWPKKYHAVDYSDIEVETWLSKDLQKWLSGLAIKSIKRQKFKHRKNPPIFKGHGFSLGYKFFSIMETSSTFDFWVRLKNIGKDFDVKLPVKRNRYANRFLTWTAGRSINLGKNIKGRYTIGIEYTRISPKLRVSGRTIGVDIGYKKLLITSENQLCDLGLEKQYNKIVRKKIGSKAFYRALEERDNLINQSVNLLDLTDVREVVCENLKYVKHDLSKIKNKAFSRKLQHWRYPKVLVKLMNLTEEQGVILTRVGPARTSQKCSSCGIVCKSNRRGENYTCSCGNIIDADLNAAINISHKGIYSSHAK